MKQKILFSLRDLFPEINRYAIVLFIEFRDKLDSIMHFSRSLKGSGTDRLNRHIQTQTGTHRLCRITNFLYRFMSVFEVRHRTLENRYITKATCHRPIDVCSLLNCPSQCLCRLSQLVSRSLKCHKKSLHKCILL